MKLSMKPLVKLLKGSLKRSPQLTRKVLVGSDRHLADIITESDRRLKIINVFSQKH